MAKMLTLDPAPLLALIERTWENDSEAARALDINRYSILRWRSGTRIRELKAEEIAVKCGLHPVDIWRDWFEQLADHDDELLAAYKARRQRGNELRNERRKARRKEAANG